MLNKTYKLNKTSAKNKILILASLVFACQIARAESPKQKPKFLQVEYEFRHRGAEVCRGSARMLSGATYKVCEPNINGKFFEVRLNTDFIQTGQITFAAEITEFDRDGKIVDCVHPIALGLDGESAEISTGEISPLGTETNSMNVKAHIL